MVWPHMVAEWIPYIKVMGYLYTLMMFTAMVVAISTFYPLEYKKLHDQIGEEGPARMPKTLVSLSLVSAAVVWIVVHAELPVAFAAVVGFFYVALCWKAMGC